MKFYVNSNLDSQKALHIELVENIRKEIQNWIFVLWAYLELSKAFEMI